MLFYISYVGNFFYLFREERINCNFEEKLIVKILQKWKEVGFYFQLGVYQNVLERELDLFICEIYLFFFSEYLVVVYIFGIGRVVVFFFCLWKLGYEVEVLRLGLLQSTVGG